MTTKWEKFDQKLQFICPKAQAIRAFRPKREHPALQNMIFFTF
jgi:hypothetical protein